MTNGREIIKIGVKGVKWFAIAGVGKAGDANPPEDGEPFDLDVVHTYSQYIEIDRPFRNADGKVDPDRLPELNQAAIGFVHALLATAGLDTTKLDTAQAFAFLARLAEENSKLADFFVVRSGEKPSSPPNSPVAVTFSTD